MEPKWCHSNKPCGAGTALLGRTGGDLGDGHVATTAPSGRDSGGSFGSECPILGHLNIQTHHAGVVGPLTSVIPWRRWAQFCGMRWPKWLRKTSETSHSTGNTQIIKLYKTYKNHHFTPYFCAHFCWLNP